MAASFHYVPGVRVGGSAFLHPPVAAPDATTRTLKANPHGSGRRADCSVTSTAKRSYKRAQHRAARFGYTIYKGTLHSAEMLRSEYISNQDSKLQCAPQRHNRNPSRSTSSQHIQVFLWNASGLSAARMAELFQGLAATSLDPDILIITESHWVQSCAKYMPHRELALPTPDVTCPLSRSLGCSTSLWLRRFRSSSTTDRRDNNPAPCTACLPHVKASLEADPALATRFQELFHKCRDGHASDINAAMLKAWATVCPAKNAVKPSQTCDNTTSMVRALWHQRQQVRTSCQAVQHACQGSARPPLLAALFQLGNCNQRPVALSSG